MKVIKFKVVEKIFTKLSLNTEKALLRWCLEQVNNVNIGTGLSFFSPKTQVIKQQLIFL